MQSKPIARPWAVLTDGKLDPYYCFFPTRQSARSWVAVSPYRIEHCKVVRVEVYLAK